MNTYRTLGWLSLVALVGCGGAGSGNPGEEGEPHEATEEWSGFAADPGDFDELPMEITFEAKAGAETTKFTTRGAARGCGRISFPGTSSRWMVGYPMSEDPRIDYLTLIAGNLPSSGVTNQMELSLVTTDYTEYRIMTFEEACERGDCVGSGTVTLNDRKSSAILDVVGRTGDGSEVKISIHCSRTG